ncbi:MAG: sugar transferase, partial [Bdellovibrionota bacterium]
MGFYQSLRLKTTTEIISMCLKGLVFEFFILGSMVFLFQAKSTSRYFFGLYILINYSALIIEKLGGRTLLSSIRKRGFNYRQVLVAGTGENAREVVRSLRRHKHWGYQTIGYLEVPSQGRRTARPAGELDLPILGTLADMEDIIKSKAIDEVYFAPDVFEPDVFDKSIIVCEKLGIISRISLGHFDLAHSKVTFSMLDHLPVFTFYTSLMTPTQAIIKRTIDIAVSLVGIGICSVLYPWISWRIRRESPGPSIFKQVRVGENGRRFKCYKFRTMYLDAEARKKELLERNQMSGPIFKIDNDPRIFPFGAFLRRSSLDELPQFLNILRGDMSVVGTRPPTPDEVDQYKTHFRRRLSIRPGLTGL